MPAGVLIIVTPSLRNMPCIVQWLCIFFGESGHHMWVWQRELLSFEEHKEEAIGM
jgi:hypothetical protein